MGHSCGYEMRGRPFGWDVSMSIRFHSSEQIGRGAQVETDVIKNGGTILLCIRVL